MPSASVNIKGAQTAHLTRGPVFPIPRLCDTLPHNVEDNMAMETLFDESEDLLDIRKDNTFKRLRRLGPNRQGLHYNGHQQRRLRLGNRWLKRNSAVPADFQSGASAWRRCG